MWFHEEILFGLKLQNLNIDSDGFISTISLLFLESFLHHLHLDIHLAKWELRPILPISPHVIATSCLGTFLSLCVQCILHLLAWVPIRMCHQVYLSSSSSAGGPTFILSCRSCPKRPGTTQIQIRALWMCIIYLSIYLSIYLPTDLPTYLSTYLPTHLSITRFLVVMFHSGPE